VFDGVDMAVNARFGHGGVFTLGVSTGQTVWNDCVVVDNPAGIQLPNAFSFTAIDTPQRDCKRTLAWGDQFQLKMNGVYPLPGDFTISGVFQNVPGAPYIAAYGASIAEIAPTLGRNPSGGASTQIQLVTPNTLFEDRLTQVDARLARTFKFGRTKLAGQVDLYNIFNASSVLGQVTAFGPNWRNANQVMGARTLKFGAQLDF
jgi:hypothetical protein